MKIKELLAKAQAELQTEKEQIFMEDIKTRQLEIDAARTILAKLEKEFNEFLEILLIGLGGEIHMDQNSPFTAVGAFEQSTTRRGICALRHSPVHACHWFQVPKSARCVPVRLSRSRVYRPSG